MVVKKKTRTFSSKKTTKSTSRKTKKCGESGANGSKVGTKRSDYRYRDASGEEWASKLEYLVYSTLRASGVYVLRTTSYDALRYSTSVKNGYCNTCGAGASDVVQARVYTPDLVVYTPTGKMYLEVKGYFDGPKRNLFKQALACNPTVDVRLIASNNHWVSKPKTRITDWAQRYRIPVHIWDGGIPDGWLL